jgi:hypothetical protein
LAAKSLTGDAAAAVVDAGMEMDRLVVASVVHIAVVGQDNTFVGFVVIGTLAGHRGGVDHALMEKPQKLENSIEECGMKSGDMVATTFARLPLCPEFLALRIS